MRSNNPVFARSEEFNRGGVAQSYSDPSTWGTGAPGGTDTFRGTEGRMTVDSTVQKTAISLAVVIVFAAATWWLTGGVTTEAEAQTTAGQLYLLAMVGAGAAFVLSLVNSFKKVISPALVIAFAAAEGIALGAMSKVIDTFIAPGVVTGAVFGTFAAFAGTLAAYKFLNIQVGDKFRRGVMAGVLGMVALGLMSLVLSLFGVNTGLFGFGTLGLVMSVVGLVLGVFMLILDFDFVEQGVANGLPERESWRAAFGLTVSLVWIYTNLLRILAILQQD